MKFDTFHIFNHFSPGNYTSKGNYTSNERGRMKLQSGKILEPTSCSYFTNILIYAYNLHKFAYNEKLQ